MVWIPIHFGPYLFSRLFRSLCIKKNIHSQHTPSRHAHEQTYTTTIGNKSISKLSLSDNTLVAMMIVGSCVLVLCVQLSANYSPPPPTASHCAWSQEN